MAADLDSAGLSASQLSAFWRDGYLIIRNALRPATVASLLAETHRLLHEEFSLENHPLTRFSTGGKSEHVGDDYFLSSGDKVRFFLEEDAFDDATGALTKPKERAVNKIGHYLHVLSPPFARLTNPRGTEQKQQEQGLDEISPAAVARSLGFRDPRCLQSMVICKQPEIGGAVPPHQDSTFLYTEPPSAVGFWYALEDATLDNGCLSFLPGSHRWAPVRKRLVRKPVGSGGGTEMVDNEGAPFPLGGGDNASKGEAEGHASERPAYVAAEVRAGDLVLIHGNLLHKSEKNTSEKGRVIYTFHIIEWDGCEYDARNWLQPPDEGFTKLYNT